jgi:hypothetical protein
MNITKDFCYMPYTSIIYSNNFFRIQLILYYFPITCLYNYYCTEKQCSKIDCILIHYKSAFVNKKHNYYTIINAIVNVLPSLFYIYLKSAILSIWLNICVIKKRVHLFYKFYFYNSRKNKTCIKSRVFKQVVLALINAMQWY